MWASSSAPCRSSLSLLSSTSRSHIGKRLNGPREKLCEQDLRANIPLLSPTDHLGPGELIVEEVSLVLVSVGHDWGVGNEVFHFRQDRREPWSVLEIGGPNSVDLDGLGVDWPIRVDPGAPRLALAPALAFAQPFDEPDCDDDARGSPTRCSTTLATILSRCRFARDLAMPKRIF